MKATSDSVERERDLTEISGRGVINLTLDG